MNVNVEELIGSARSSLSSRTVFAEPYERDGLTVIPAAKVAGGGGAGTGQEEEGPQGEGGGFGIMAKPAGAYIIDKDDNVRWQPAVDPNRIVAAVAAVVAVALIARAASTLLRAKSSASD